MALDSAPAAWCAWSREREPGRRSRAASLGGMQGGHKFGALEGAGDNAASGALAGCRWSGLDRGTSATVGAFGL